MKLYLILFTTIFIFDAVNCHSSECSEPDDCDYTPCDSYEIDDLIRHLWRIPKFITNDFKKLPPLAVAFRDAILNNLDTASDDEKLMFISMTLWNVDCFTGFGPIAAPSCVFLNLVKKSIQYSKGECERKELNDPIIQYGLLCGSALNHTIDISMQMSGCPWKPYKPYDYPLKCKVDFPIDEFIACQNLPSDIEKALYGLLNAPRSQTRVGGYGALVSMTNENKHIFKTMFNRGELLPVARLKCCHVKPPKHCCAHRKREIMYRYKRINHRLKNTWIDMLVIPKKEKKCSSE